MCQALLLHDPLKQLFGEPEQYWYRLPQETMHEEEVTE